MRLNKPEEISLAIQIVGLIVSLVALAATLMR
jgi:hypothetical protein